MAHPLVKLAIVAAAVVGAALAVLVTWMVLRLIARRVLLIKTLTRRMHRPFQTLVVTIALDVGLRASSMAEGHWRRLVVHLADLSVIAASAWLITSLLFVVEEAALSKFRTDVRDNRYARTIHTQVVVLRRVTVEPGRQIYPLSAVTPLRFAQDRIALVGEAAHVFPPIGAQGLNLGIRDIEDLIGIACENRRDPGSATALAAYNFKRRPDILARSSAVNLLNMSLLSDMLPAQIARVAGLGVLGGFAPLRAFFMREGLRPGSGFAALAGGLRRPVRR